VLVKFYFQILIQNYLQIDLTVKHLNNHLRLAIISDMHCHADNNNNPRESFLLAGARRLPVGKHPVQSLISLIKEQKLTADVLVCPGDLTNKICQAGMVQAWDHLREIKQQLNSHLLLTTIGNHDVDSRKDHGQDPFEIPKNLHVDFPLPDGPSKDSFWSRGFCFVYDEKLKIDFVILNTVVAHHDEKSAARGTFEHSHLDAMNNILQQREKDLYKVREVKYRVAIMHHHPTLHSRIDYSSSDVLQIGDQILRLLAKYGFQLILHGHRHDPRITRMVTDGTDQLVFAAGAFSAYLKELASVTRNLFHLVTVSNNQAGTLKGTVSNWEFNFGCGWTPSTFQSAALPYYVGFSLPRMLPDLNGLCKSCDSATGGQLRNNEVIQACPELENQLPEELTIIQNKLLKLGYKLTIKPTGEIEALGRI